MNVDEFFAGHEQSRRIFDAVAREVDVLEGLQVRVSKSEVAFRRRVNFAFAWIPEVCLRRACAPLVLSVRLLCKDSSPRWKSVTEPVPGRFTHHLELWRATDIDDEVRAWIAEAWRDAQ